jgi:HK97 family phage major capsid protein
VPSNAVLERLAAERGTVHEMVESILAGAEADDRDPTESERELLARHKGRLAELEVQIAELADVAEQVAGARDVAPLIRRDTPPQPVAAAPEAPQTVYRTFGEFARDELIARYDLIASHAGGEIVKRAAVERLARAVANTLTADVPGLVPPQHLAQITDVINASRPIVSNSRQVPLSSGKLTYPKITQRPVVGVQATEKTELPSQKMTVAMVEVLAATYGGSGDLSWQAINWSTPDALGLYFDLMAEAYAIATETAAGTELGTHTGADAELATDDYAGWYAAITEAAGNVYSASKRFADAIYCAPALAFHLAGFVSNVSPSFGAGGSINISQGGAGNIAGLKLVASHGLVGNACFVGNAASLLVAETPGAPVEMRAVEPSIGGMEVGVIGAFKAELTDGDAFSAIVNVVPLGAAATQAKTGGNGK